MSSHKELKIKTWNREFSEANYTVWFKKPSSDMLSKQFAFLKEKVIRAAIVCKATVINYSVMIYFEIWKMWIDYFGKSQSV